MKTFNFDKPYEELSFNEVLSVLLVIVDEIRITKFGKSDEFNYLISLFRTVRDYTNEDEFELNYLNITWNISSEVKDLNSLKNQNSKTRNLLDSYFESVINLGLIELKFIE